MRLRFTALVVITLILMMSIGGCTQLVSPRPSATPSVTHQQSGPIEIPTVPPRSGPPGVTWYLVSLQDGNATVPVIPDTTITAVFDGQGTLSGTAGCNQYNASYTNGKDNLTISPPTSTERSCGSPAGVMAQESLYLAKIQEVRGYSVDDTLKLRNGRGEVILTYSTVTNGTPVPASLTTTTWYVHSLVDAAGRTHSPRGLTTIRLIFGADGYLYGNAGCNNHYGSYERAGADSITIRDPQTTRIYCGIAGVMELESTYLSILPRITRYSISGDTLRLSDAEGKVTIDCTTTSP